jgi:hypothetical protein
MAEDDHKRNGVAASAVARRDNAPTVPSSRSGESKNARRKRLRRAEDDHKRNGVAAGAVARRDDAATVASSGGGESKNARRKRLRREREGELQSRPHRQSNGMMPSSPDVESAKKRKKRRKKKMAAMACRLLYDDLLPLQDQGREEPPDADREPLFSSSPGNNIDVDDDERGRSSILKTKDPKRDGGKEDNGSAPINSTTPKSVRIHRKCSHQNCPNLAVKGGRCITHGAQRKCCMHPGCNKHVKQAGLCSTHGAPRRRCNHEEGCTNFAVQGGRCVAHGAQRRMCCYWGGGSSGGGVLVCGKRARVGGMCKNHHGMVKGRGMIDVVGGTNDLDDDDNDEVDLHCRGNSTLLVASIQRERGGRTTREVVVTVRFDGRSEEDNDIIIDDDNMITCPHVGRDFPRGNKYKGQFGDDGGEDVVDAAAAVEKNDDNENGLVFRPECTSPLINLGICQPVTNEEWLNTNFSAPQGDDNGIVFSKQCHPSNDGVKKCFNTFNKKICSHGTEEVSLNLVGQYVIFPARWWHRGYFRITSNTTYYTAQLFCTAARDINSWSNRTRSKNKEMTIQQLPFEDVREVSHDVKNHWDTTYSKSKFPPSKAFDGPIDRATNRHLQQDSFRIEPKMKAFVNVFERSYRHLRVNSIWLIKKSKDNHGFQSWHRDFFLGTDIIATIVVNVGVCENAV